MITVLDTASKEGSSLPIRYSSLELLSQDDTSRATKAMDVWSVACLFHELLSDKIPFRPTDFKATAVIGKGDKPARPGQRGRGGSEISDAAWSILLKCWEYSVEDRPASRIKELLSDIYAEDGRPEPKPLIEPHALRDSYINFSHGKTILTRVLGSDMPNLQVLEHLRNILTGLVYDQKALKATMVMATKLSREDTQTLIDGRHGFPFHDYTSLFCT
ncbi:hypothetical protein AN958_00289 [Leucoagaricus sp. SymC.cos]|nr:hypothetical protein AN958_00289 [Leucoagaricus sp. SymC.cos]